VPGGLAEPRGGQVGQVMMVPLTAADLDRMAELVQTYGSFLLGLVDASVISAQSGSWVPGSAGPAAIA
jgi:hypothetical protein